MKNKSQNISETLVEHHRTMLNQNQKASQAQLKYQKQQQIFPNQNHAKKEQQYINFKQNSINSSNNNNNSNFKDLVVSVEESYPIVYNLQPTSSFENSSSRSLIDSDALMRNNKLILSDNNNNDVMNSFQDTTNNIEKLRSSSKEDFKEKNTKSKTSNSLSTPKIDPKLKLKDLKLEPPNQMKFKQSKENANNNNNNNNNNNTNNNANSKSNSSKTFLSCYIIQLYFIYLILCTIIICCSFGFYYTIVSTNLRLDFLEKKINEKTELPIRFISQKEYSEKLKNGINNNEDYFNPELLKIAGGSKHLKNDYMDKNQKYNFFMLNDEYSNFKGSNENLNEQNENENLKNSIPKLNAEFYVIKRLNKSDFILYPVYEKFPTSQFQNYCLSIKNYCVDLMHQEKSKNDNENLAYENNKSSISDNEIVNSEKDQDSENSYLNDKKNNDYWQKSESSPNFKTKEFEDMPENEYYDKYPDNDFIVSYHKYVYSTEPKPINIFSKAKSSTVSSSTTISTTKIATNTISTTAATITSESTTTTTSTTLKLIETNTESFKVTRKKFNASSRINDNFESKNGKIRHRKRIEIDSSNSTRLVTTNLDQNNEIIYIKPLSECTLNFINPNPISVIFMGVFHCTWMNDIGASNNYYYITKSYKGSSVTMCQNADELKSYRCYRHLPLQYSYYGTGHVIYKGYMFYNQEGTRDLIIHSVEKHDTRKVSAPEEAACCEMDNYLYSVKHSGYFDFETDENGLWLIYKLGYDFNYEVYSNEINKSENYNNQLNQDYIEDTYVVAKIDENDFKNLKIEKKWYIRMNRENVANIFISCGQLYALKETITNPAVLYKLCDLYNDYECSNSYENELFNITISSRQLTSLSYNPDKKLLYMVDGGSFVYYKMQISN